MTDYSELKRLAEAATPGPWVTENNELYWSEDGYTKHLMETFDGNDICHDEEHPANLRFIAAANPAAVLELIAENERLRLDRGDPVGSFDKHMQYMQENIQLKAENERLSILVDQGFKALDRVNAMWRRNFEKATGGPYPIPTLSADDEFDQLKAENDRFRELMAAVAREKPRSLSYPPGNAPGHSHAIPGIWDSDNGDKAGTECGWCKVWNAAMAMAKGV